MKDNAKRARLAIIFIWIILFINFALFFVSYLQYDMLLMLERGEFVSDEAINFNDQRNAFVSVAYTVLFLISTIVYIHWFRRAYFNLHTKVKHLNYDEGWAAGAWFVPILNWFRPYHIMQELYQETYRLLRKSVVGYHQSLNLNIVSFWWFFWVINNIFSNFTNRLAADANTIESLLFSTKMNMFELVLAIPTALLAIKVVKTYAEMEEQLIKLDDEVMATRVQENLGDYDDILDAPI